MKKFIFRHIFDTDAPERLRGGKIEFFDDNGSLAVDIHIKFQPSPLEKKYIQEKVNEILKENGHDMKLVYREEQV